jgi:hypothetical protein
VAVAVTEGRAVGDGEALLLVFGPGLQALSRKRTSARQVSMELLLIGFLPGVRFR